MDWIKVSERLPAYGVHVIASTESGWVIPTRLINTDHDGHHWHDILLKNKVVYWMPLPKAPANK